MSGGGPTIHGHRRGDRSTATYRSYDAARNRCCNPNTKNYHCYGGRGIRFLYESFAAFLADMGEKPPGTTLERRDNDGDYRPGNCCWATVIDQANNRRTNRMLVVRGRTQTIAQWAREKRLRYKTLWNRLQSGWEAEAALRRRRRHGNRYRSEGHLQV